MAISVREIIESYRDNADYEETGSASKAQAFATACRRLLGMPKRSRKGGGAGIEEEFDHETLKTQLDDALRYVDAVSDESTLDVDFSEFDRRR